MILSMINLTADFRIADEAKPVLMDIGSRIKAVSELYNLLYSTNTVDEVQLDEYLEKVTSKITNILSDNEFY